MIFWGVFLLVVGVILMLRAISLAGGLVGVALIVVGWWLAFAGIVVAVVR